MDTQYFDVDNITVTRGDDWQDTYKYVDYRNKPINITGFNIAIEFFDETGSGAPLLVRAAILDDALNGVFRFSVSKTVLAALTQNLYQYSVTITDTALVSVTRIKGFWEIVEGIEQNCGGC